MRYLSFSVCLILLDIMSSGSTGRYRQWNTDIQYLIVYLYYILYLFTWLVLHLRYYDWCIVNIHVGIFPYADFISFGDML